MHKLHPKTAAKLKEIGFLQEELEFFTEEQAQETIRRFNEKLKRTNNFDSCCVTIGK